MTTPSRRRRQIKANDDRRIEQRKTSSDVTSRRDLAAEDDTSLVERFVAGDAAAFDVLVARNYERIFHLVRGILGDWHLSEDVCQDVFATVYRGLGSFRREARFSVWLHRIAVNAALKARKRWKRRRMETLESAAEPTESSSRDLESTEEILRLLRPLPPELKVPVLLRDVVGLTYAEMTEVLGGSRGALEQRLYRAMTLLRRIWNDQEN